MRHIPALLTALALAATSIARAAEPLSAPYITGSHYSARELLAAYLEDVGHPVTAERLETIARRIEEMYRRDGFVAPQVVTQQAGGPTPHLHVFEVRIVGVSIHGDAGKYRARVAAAAAQLESQGVLHQARMRRVIGDLAELPGLAVRTSFVPAEQARNAYVLRLDVEHRRIDGRVVATSRVADELGDGLFSAQLAMNSVLGAGERLTATAASSSTFGLYSYFSGRVERRFGPVDVALTASRADADMHAESHYDSQRFGLEARAAVLRTERLVLRPFAGLAVRNASDRDSLGEAWSLTRTRAAQAGLELTHGDATASTHWRLAGVRGLDAWDARTLLRNADAPDTTFTKVMLDLQHARTLAPGWLLRAGAEAQWSGDDLPAGERFTYGGAPFGRAFDPGAMLADRGATASLQVEHSRGFDSAWFDSGRIYLQGDYGLGREAAAGAAGLLRGASVSLGLGARTQALTTTFELGYAVKRLEPDSRRLRAFVTTQYAF